MTNPGLVQLHIGKKIMLAAAAMVAACVPFFVGMVYAQSSSFEVASIRLSNRPSLNEGKSKNGGGNGAPLSSFGGGRFEFTDSTLQFIVRAYNLHTCAFPIRRDGSCALIVGGPDWIHKDDYDVIAKIPAGTQNFDTLDYIGGNAKPLYAMLNTLLQDRFQLRTHYETREVPVYAIVVAKNGPKLAKSAGKMTKRPGTDIDVKDTSFRFTPGGDVNGERQVRMVVRAHTMGLLATDMSMIMERPVIDHTALEGEFDFGAEFPIEQGAGAGAELRGPGLFTAFQEQLGLRLEATKAPMQVLVIDSIERPSEN